MRSRKTLSTLAAIVASAALAGCPGKQSEQGREPEHEPAATMTERERDSTIAHSELPGAGVIGRAMLQADSAAARAARANAQSD